MVSPAGFEPATPGLEVPHSGVYSVAPIPRSPFPINEFAFWRVYPFAPKIAFPSLRGDAVVTDALREPCAG